MGVSICVAELAGVAKEDQEYATELRKSFTSINKLLAKNSLVLHNEPEEIEVPDFREEMDTPFSYIHSLRKCYAYFVSGRELKPLEEEEDASEDPILESCWNPKHHLIYHSDCDGFYLPIYFEEAIYDEQIQVPGGIVGSSIKLKEELLTLAPALGIELVDNDVTMEEIERIEQEWQEEKFASAQQAWFMFFEAARLSIEYKTAIYMA